MAIWRTKWGWRARVQIEKQTYYVPGVYKLKSEAKAAAKQEKEKIKTAMVSTDISPCLYELAGRYLDYAEIQFSMTTYQEKRHCLQRLVSYLGDVSPAEVNTATVANFLVERARLQSNNAANKDRKNIKAFFRWLQDYHGIIHDPTGPIRQKPHTKKTRRLIPIQDIFSVIMAAPMPERALISAYWHTGARRGEVLRWVWAEDVNLEERWVRLGTKKNRDGSMQYARLSMNDNLWAILTEVWQKHRDPNSPYVFPKYCVLNSHGENETGDERAHRLLMGYSKRTAQGEKRYPGLCEKAGVPIFGYHDIRHTVAKYLNDIQKVGMKRVQEVLRHRRQATTEIYLEGSYSGTSATLKLLEWETVLEMSQKMSQKE